MTSIDKSAFNGCHKLASITVSAGNTIYHSAGNAIIETATKTLVQGCQTTIIPDDGSVISIGDSAFYDINGLTSITIPDSVISMGNYAFFSCYYLNSVTIGSGITSIGDSAFSMCNTTRLTITVNATTPPTLGNSAISAKQILVPAESVDAYKAASGWSSYASKISAIAA